MMATGEQPSETQRKRPRLRSDNGDAERLSEDSILGDITDRHPISLKDQTPHEPIRTPDSLPSPKDITTSLTIESLLSPANPRLVRGRDRKLLAKLPAGSSALSMFSELRHNEELTDEEALIRFINTYDVPLTTLNKLSSSKLPCSFSKVKYTEIAPYVWLDPSARGRDMKVLHIFRSRLPKSIFACVFRDMFTEIVCLFGAAVRNVPEAILESETTKRGRIEHHFYAVNSVSIVFLEVKKVLLTGRERLDVVAQVVAECCACDYVNSSENHWVPILGILSDGQNFEYFVFDSGIKQIFCSGSHAGLIENYDGDLFLQSLKRTVEYVYDFFLTSYVNGLRCFLHRSEQRAVNSRKKRQSTERWSQSLRDAEEAHLACRQAAELGAAGMYQQADMFAQKGVELLNQSIQSLPESEHPSQDISKYWNDTVVDTA